MKHLLSPLDLSVTELEDLLKTKRPDRSNKISIE